jgi:hypothetical protein
MTDQTQDNDSVEDLLVQYAQTLTESEREAFSKALASHLRKALQSARNDAKRASEDTQTRLATEFEQEASRLPRGQFNADARINLVCRYRQLGFDYDRYMARKTAEAHEKYGYRS